MTAFEWIVPVIALAIAAGGVAYARWQTRKLDQDTAHHPAE